MLTFFLYIVNIADGAHHSDLSHLSDDHCTKDVVEARAKIFFILQKWLSEFKHYDGKNNNDDVEIM